MPVTAALLALALGARGAVHESLDVGVPRVDIEAGSQREACCRHAGEEAFERKAAVV